MKEHVVSWLDAYYDGELHGGRKRQVEAHLAECAHCRRALEALEALSTLLDLAPSPAPFTPPERFVAQVRLQLAPRKETPLQRLVYLSQWLVPAGLVGVWAFIQVVWLLSGALLAITGLGEQFGTSPSMVEYLLSWVPFIDPGPAGRVFEVVSTLLWTVLVPLGSTALLALLYWAWFAGWHSYQQYLLSAHGEAT
ncbi:MAG: anti-sigma factor family protein [Anaerolineales bacterium]